jgi:hypothetical protein
VRRELCAPTSLALPQAWDKTARGLDLKSAELSTYAVFGVSGALTLALAATTI